MEMSVRIDGFEGTEAEYIKYLEKSVISLRHTTQGRSFSESSPRPNKRPRPGEISFEFWQPATTEPVEACPKWKQVARKLVRDTPARWWQRAATDNGALVFLLSAGTETLRSTNSVSFPSSSDKQSINRIREFAVAARQRACDAELTLRFANFQKFLILSACVVLRSLDVSHEVVFEIVRICVNSSVHISDRYCGRVLRTVVFLNEFIDAMNVDEWQTNGSELLLQWDLPISSYIHLTDSPPASLEYLTQHLCTQELTPTTHKNHTPISVPTLVHNMIGPEIHVARIANALNYRCAHALEETRVNPWQYFNEPFGQFQG